MFSLRSLVFDLVILAGVSSGFSPQQALPATANPNTVFFSRWRRRCWQQQQQEQQQQQQHKLPSSQCRRTTVMLSASSTTPNDIGSPEEEETPPSSLSMDDLRKRMTRQDSQYAMLLREQSKFVDEQNVENGREERSLAVPESVHIILFHPDTPRQHIHTIEYPKGSGNNIILAFECGMECVSFARNLQDLEFVDPSPEETLFEPFAEYCEMSGISLAIVPKGFDLTPPQLNAADDGDDDDDGRRTRSIDDEFTGVPNTTTDNDDADGDELDSWG